MSVQEPVVHPALEGMSIVVHLPTDGVEAVMDEFVGHPKVRLLTQANQKLPKALSNAFEFARGPTSVWSSDS